MGATSFAMWIIFSLGEVASVGVHAVSSNHEGAKERQKIGATVVAGLWLSGLLSVTALALLPLDGIGAYFRLLGLGGEASAEVRAAGHGYLWHTVLGAFPMAAAGVVASGFKGARRFDPVLLAILPWRIELHPLSPPLGGVKVWVSCGPPSA